MMATKPGGTFSLQDQLPSYPVPQLSNTLHLYLQSVKPHLSESEFSHTKELVEKFRVDEGPILQEALLKHAETRRNWLEQWWEEKVYLEPRYPIFPLINFGGPGLNYPKEGVTQLQRGATVLHLLAVYWSMLRNGKIPIMKSRGVPWCMNQARRVMGTCRIPGEKCDRFAEHFKTAEEGVTPTFAVVLCRGHYWRVELFDHSTGLPYEIKDVQRALRYIKEQSRDSRPSLGALTCDQRTTWAKNRDYLISLSPHNASTLRAIEECLLLLVLTDTTPQGKEQLARAAVLGDPDQMWADKCMTMHIHANGANTCNCDHGQFDAIVQLMTTHFMTEAVKMKQPKYLSDADTASGPIEPELLPLVIDDHVINAIDKAKRVVTPLTDDALFNVVSFDDYGNKTFRRHKAYGDTCIQLGIQLAYYRLHKCFAPTYETASTRKFYHGRTETVRSCTPQSAEWVRAVEDHNKTPEERQRLFRIAYDRHNELMAECTQGRGVDRHFLGLRCIAQQLGHPDPALFSDPAWKRSGGDGNFILSTSFTGYTETYGGVVPMCRDGYGCFYRIGPDVITFSLSTWRSSTVTDIQAFGRSLIQAMRDLDSYLPMTQKL